MNPKKEGGDGDAAPKGSTAQFPTNVAGSERIYALVVERSEGNDNLNNGSVKDEREGVDTGHQLDRQEHDRKGGSSQHDEHNAQHAVLGRGSRRWIFGHFVGGDGDGDRW